MTRSLLHLLSLLVLCIGCTIETSQQLPHNQKDAHTIHKEALGQLKELDALWCASKIELQENANNTNQLDKHYWQQSRQQEQDLLQANHICELLYAQREQCDNLYREACDKLKKLHDTINSTKRYFLQLQRTSTENRMVIVEKMKQLAAAKDAILSRCLKFAMLEHKNAAMEQFQQLQNYVQQQMLVTPTHNTQEQELNIEEQQEHMSSALPYAADTGDMHADNPSLTPYIQPLSKITFEHEK